MNRISPLAPGQHRVRGFTLVELIVVIIIVGVVGAVAVPRYLAMGTDARIAAVKTMASTMRSTAENARVMCKTDPECDYTSQLQFVTIGGKQALMDYGWLDAGDGPPFEDSEIIGWVNVAGFTTSNSADTTYSLFTLDGSPDPANCSVTYTVAFFRGPVLGVDIVPQTSGC